MKPSSRYFRSQKLPSVTVALPSTRVAEITWTISTPRAWQTYESYNVLHGLLFSGVASSALSPFDVTTFEEGSDLRTRANVYNLLGDCVFCAVRGACRGVRVQSPYMTRHMVSFSSTSGVPSADLDGANKGHSPMHARCRLHYDDVVRVAGC